MAGIKIHNSEKTLCLILILLKQWEICW